LCNIAKLKLKKYIKLAKIAKLQGGRGEGGGGEILAL
jgi:hypothetical protein